MRVRSYATLSVLVVFFLGSDLFQRIVVYPLVRILPARGPAIYGSWQRLLSRTLFMILRTVGGADIPRPGRVPGEPGVLILMNHQSLLDIPMAVASVEGVFPRIVTRERYAKWIPIISYTIRRLGYPLVNPGAKAGTVRRQLDQLEHIAATSEVPLVLFPEGTRTRNGKVGRFQTAGIERIFRAREWKVYVLVSDGYWRHAKLAHFTRGMHELKGHLSVLGPFEWTDPEADPTDFAARMRSLMVDELARVREAQADPEADPEADAEADPGPGPNLAQTPDPAPGTA